MVKDIIAGYRKRILSGNTRGDWKVDFREEFEKEVADYEEGNVLHGSGEECSVG